MDHRNLSWPTVCFAGMAFSISNRAKRKTLKLVFKVSLLDVQQQKGQCRSLYRLR